MEFLIVGAAIIVVILSGPLETVAINVGIHIRDAKERKRIRKANNIGQAE